MAGRISTHLDAIDAWFSGLPHEGAAIVTKVHRQLDLVDAEDINRLSFKAPGGFLVLPRFRLVNRAGGGKDCEIWIVLAVASDGRPGSPSDAEVIDRATTLAAALDDATFGQLQCSAPAEIECRPVLTVNDGKGLSVAAVSFRQMLYAVVPDMPAVSDLTGLFGTGDVPQAPAPVSAGEGALTPGELAIVNSWGQS